MYLSSDLVFESLSSLLVTTGRATLAQAVIVSLDVFSF